MNTEKIKEGLSDPLAEYRINDVRVFDHFHRSFSLAHNKLSRINLQQKKEKAAKEESVDELAYLWLKCFDIDSNIGLE